MILGRLWRNSDQSSLYLPLLLKMHGQSTCLTSTVLSWMVNLTLTRRYSWSNHMGMSSQTRNSMYVCKLLKSLYGLKQAGRKWYNALCKVLDNIGFKWSKAGPAVFFARKGEDITILACHVDDCTITGSSQQLIQDYKNRLKTTYALTDLGPANWLLGIWITRNFEARTISLSQSSYINSILMWFNFTDLKPCATPMDPSICFLKDQCPQMLEEIADMNRIPYREAVGSLNYCAMAMRPNDNE